MIFFSCIIEGPKFNKVKDIKMLEMGIAAFCKPGKNLLEPSLGNWETAAHLFGGRVLGQR